MTTTVNLRKTLDRKQWEMVAPQPESTPGNVLHVLAASQLGDSLVFASDAAGSTAAGGLFIYRTDEDAWLSGLQPSTFAVPAAGACMAHHPNGPTGTASAGTATTITTTTTAAINLAGYKIRITGGTGAGQEVAIVSNTIGANSVITVASWPTATPDNTSVYLLLTGRAYYFAGGVNALRYYDVATSTYSSALTAPSSVASEAQLIATPGYYGQTGLGTGMATGTATAGAASTLTNSGKAWATNQWANFQVRITGGTGAGQVRTISSNTGTVLTVSAVWTTNPDATSTYIIEGNDDFLYLLGGGAVTLQRYSISGNSWSTLSPSPTRTTGTGTGTGTLACWANACTDSLFTGESAILNGRRIYSFSNTGGSNPVDYYDIPSNAWTNGVVIGRLNNQGVTFNSQGSCGVLVGDNWYITLGLQGGIQAGQVYRLNLPRQTLDPWSVLSYPGNTAASATPGQRIFAASYTDGGTTVRWIYLKSYGAAAWFRCMVI